MLLVSQISMLIRRYGGFVDIQPTIKKLAKGPTPFRAIVTAMCALLEKRSILVVRWKKTAGLAHMKSDASGPLKDTLSTHALLHFILAVPL